MKAATVFRTMEEQHQGEYIDATFRWAVQHVMPGAVSCIKRSSCGLKLLRGEHERRSRVPETHNKYVQRWRARELNTDARGVEVRLHSMSVTVRMAASATAIPTLAMELPRLVTHAARKERQQAATAVDNNMQNSIVITAWQQHQQQTSQESSSATHSVEPTSCCRQQRHGEQQAHPRMAS